jgi:hypothetical protein
MTKRENIVPMIDSNGHSNRSATRSGFLKFAEESRGLLQQPLAKAGNVVYYIQLPAGFAEARLSHYFRGFR